MKRPCRHVRRRRLGRGRARAAEAGHDVTGIHLALSRNPKSYRTGAAGCCTIEDSNDARRAADVIGIPFYVWDLSDRFHEDVVEDFMAEYAAGRTPNPCLRCNEKIKFAAVLERASASASTRSRPATTRGWAPARTAWSSCTGPRTWARTSPTCSACSTQEQLAHSLFPLGDTPKARGARGGRAARPVGRAEARQPRHLLHQRRRHRRLAGEKLGAGSGEIVDHATGEVLGTHEGAFGFTIGQRKGLRIGRPAADGKPRYVLDIEPVTGTVTVGPREALTVDRLDGIRPRWCGTRPGRARCTAPSSFAPTATSTARW